MCLSFLISKKCNQLFRLDHPTIRHGIIYICIFICIIIRDNVFANQWHSNGYSGMVWYGKVQWVCGLRRENGHGLRREDGHVG